MLDPRVRHERERLYTDSQQRADAPAPQQQEQYERLLEALGATRIECGRSGHLMGDFRHVDNSVTGRTMLLQDSRRAARMSRTGELVLLEDQDRALWNRDYIGEGSALVQRAVAAGEVGPYTIQAAIAAVHANAPSSAATDWGQIVALYDLLTRAEPSPVIELNRAVAVAMRDGPEPGLNLIEAILARGELENYHLAHAARADFCRRLGRTADARNAYERALSLTQQGPERRFLEGRLEALRK
jgi:RNA polymerase sigma-70 factor (ECF subfamily)